MKKKAKAVKKTAKKAVVKKAKKPLTKKEQERVEVLKDAIAQIKAEKYIATTGSYVADELDSKISSLNGYLQDVKGEDTSKIELKQYIDELVTPAAPCGVCLKGSILLSSIRKHNNLTVDEALDCELSDIASTRAQNIFGVKNADNMENFFEGDDMNSLGEVGTSGDFGEYIPSKYEKLLSDWSKKYPYPTDRILAILKNALKNNGIFKPEKLK